LNLFLRKYLSLNIDGTAITTGARSSVPVKLGWWRLSNQGLPKEIIGKAPGPFLEIFEGTAVIGWDASEVAKR
jgi:hypothetical protein